MTRIFTVECSDRSGEHSYEVRLLHEFGQGDGYLNPKKVADLWDRTRQHEVLFSDHTHGKIEPFLQVLVDPRGVWLEIFRTTGEAGPIGVAYISKVIPGFDALGHFAFWDAIARGREPIIWRIMDWMFDRFSLRRISAATPVYQHGVIRFIKKLGFTQEGVKREAVLYHENWADLIEFGITRSEFEAIFSNHLLAEMETVNG